MSDVRCRRKRQRTVGRERERGREQTISDTRECIFQSIIWNLDCLAFRYSQTILRCIRQDIRISAASRRSRSSTESILISFAVYVLCMGTMRRLWNLDILFEGKIPVYRCSTILNPLRRVSGCKFTHCAVIDSKINYSTVPSSKTEAAAAVASYNDDEAVVEGAHKTKKVVENEDGETEDANRHTWSHGEKWHYVFQSKWWRVDDGVRCGTGT